MPALLYMTLVVLGGLATLLGLSDGLWAYLVPAQRRSPVPLKHKWRTASLMTGVVFLIAGFAGYLSLAR